MAEKWSIIVRDVRSGKVVSRQTDYYMASFSNWKTKHNIVSVHVYPALRKLVIHISKNKED